ncbi:MAG TPA: FMN-binding negative transcriptional regulator [Kofleriaceae bacterium]|nr:FMN-binding negative transcriptional regulator [Kofleriaceae bacterium]
MYVPAHFDASDRAFCHELIHAYPFAPITTVTASGDLLASHLPFLLDEDRGPLGTLIGHVARNSPHHGELARGTTALVAFTGPHAYVSPTWYETHPAVPTWNYCIVHAYGVARMLDEETTRTYVDRLAQRFEGTSKTAWRFDALPSEYQNKMVRALVAFEIEIARLEGKAKLTQNRSATDIANVIAALQASGDHDQVALAQWMQRSRHRRG